MAQPADTSLKHSPTLAEVFGYPPADEALTYVPLDQIVPSRWQPRKVFDSERLLNLANDIRVHGLLNPLLVWRNEDGEYELIAGERRVRSLYALVCAHSTDKSLDDLVDKLAHDGFIGRRETIAQWIRFTAVPVWLRTVPCRVVTAPVEQLHEMAIVDNLQRADLSPLEEAHALQDLVQEYGHTQRDLAERLGKSQTWISQRLTLLQLAPEVAEQVMNGELDSATAREVARLQPAVQASAVKHLQQFGLKSKQAQRLVQRVVEIAQPQSLDGVDVNANAERRLAQIALARLPDEASRQAAVLRYAGQDGKGQLEPPKESHKYRDLIVATGLAGEGKTRYDVDAGIMWQAQAPVAGYACEACRLNGHRETVERIRNLVRAHRDNYAAMPNCASGVTTCPAFVAEGEELRLPLPNYQLDDALTDETRPFVADGYPRRTTSVEAWVDILQRYYAWADAQQAARVEREQNGVAKAIGEYIALLGGFGVTLSHFLTQPCHRCIFQREGDEGAQCQMQITPPQLGRWDNVVARTWTSGNTAIGRCRYFRLKAPQRTLPNLQAGLSPEATLHLLDRLTKDNNYSGGKRAPYWLDAKRADGQPGPTWGEAEPVLLKLLPVLEPGQRLALVYLWTAHFTFDTDTYRGPLRAEAFVPDQGCVITYEVGQTYKA